MSNRLPSAASVGIYYEQPPASKTPTATLTPTSTSPPVLMPMAMPLPLPLTVTTPTPTPTPAETTASQQFQYTQQVQLHQSQQFNATSGASKSSTMHFPSVFQQRLNDYHQPMGGYESHYPPVAAPDYTAFGGAPCSVPGYVASHHYANQLQRQPYDNLYSSRTMGSGSGGFYVNRTRYLPYQQQQQQHSMRGMYTPAGQQLIPSSVLHYPPRGEPYYQQHQQHQAQQQQQQQRQQQQQQQQQQLLQQQQHAQHATQQQHMSVPQQQQNMGNIYGRNEP